MKKLLLVVLAFLVALAVSGCATTQPADPGLVAYASGKLAVYIAAREGVNNLEWAAIRPAVQDARKTLLAAPADRPVVIADILEARLDVLALGMDPIDAAFAKAALVDFLRALRLDAPSDADAEKALAVAEKFLAGVDDGIGILPGVSTPPMGPAGPPGG